MKLTRTPPVPAGPPRTARREFLAGVGGAALQSFALSAAAISGVVGFASNVGATARVLSLSELVARSDAILALKPQTSHAEWRQIFGGNRIVTTFSSGILRQLSSPVTGAIVPPRALLKLSVLGGQVAGLVQRVAHAPSVYLGQVSLAFLLSERGSSWVVGMDQGCFALRPDLSGQLRVWLTPEQQSYAGQAGSAAQELAGLDLDAVAAKLERIRGC